MSLSLSRRAARYLAAKDRSREDLLARDRSAEQFACMSRPVLSLATTPSRIAALSVLPATPARQRKSGNVFSWDPADRLAPPIVNEVDDDRVVIGRMHFRDACPQGAEKV